MEKVPILNNPWVLIPLVAWMLAWKGIALWRAARRNELGWFMALLVLNTVGILEIIYIFLVTKKKRFEAPGEGQSSDSIRKKII